MYSSDASAYDIHGNQARIRFSSASRRRSAVARAPASAPVVVVFFRGMRFCHENVTKSRVTLLSNRRAPHAAKVAERDRALAALVEALDH